MYSGIDLYRTLDANEQSYYDALYAHINRHLCNLGIDG